MSKNISWNCIAVELPHKYLSPVTRRRCLKVVHLEYRAIRNEEGRKQKNDVSRHKETRNASQSVYRFVSFTKLAFSSFYVSVDNIGLFCLVIKFNKTRVCSYLTVYTSFCQVFLSIALWLNTSLFINAV